MLEALPSDDAEFYGSEAALNPNGDNNADELMTLRQLGKRVGGSRSEYVAYFNRSDIEPFWHWGAQSEVKAMCSFKTVAKSDGVHLRKILQL